MDFGDVEHPVTCEKCGVTGMIDDMVSWGEFYIHKWCFYDEEEATEMKP